MARTLKHRRGDPAAHSRWPAALEAAVESQFSCMPSANLSTHGKRFAVVRPHSVGYGTCPAGA